MKNLLPLLLVTLLAGCSGSHHPSQDKVAVSKDSIKQKAIDSQMAKGEFRDSDEAGPSFEEIMANLLVSYHKIERIDTLVIDGKDSLHVHCKYYCLHDSALIIPKRYVWGGRDKNKDFVTHDFASDIVIIKNRDTIFNRTFIKRDFMPVIDKYLKKYAALFSPYYDGYNDKFKGEFLFAYSISIPLTDVGVPAYVSVDKNGNYKILDEYAIKD